MEGVILDDYQSPGYEMEWVQEDECQMWDGEVSDSGILDKVVIDHSFRNELCLGKCSHKLAGCEVQLNRCVFYKELYMSGEVDQRADYLYTGVAHGFDIVDSSCEASYFCNNYLSIRESEFSTQMDEIILNELRLSKVSLVDSRPDCVHALGAIRKSNGKLRPITDCRRPLGLSINNFMASMCGKFTYTTIDDVCDSLSGQEYMAVVDIRSAYRSVNVCADHRRFQGFLWEYEGRDRFFTDNCLCFGLRCAPYVFTQITEFLIRCMNKQGFHRVYGYIDDFLIIGSSQEECAEGLRVFLDLLDNLGFLVAWDKLERPSHSYIFRYYY